MFVSYRVLYSLHGVHVSCTLDWSMRFKKFSINYSVHFDPNHKYVM